MMLFRIQFYLINSLGKVLVLHPLVEFLFWNYLLRQTLESHLELNYRQLNKDISLLYQ